MEEERLFLVSWWQVWQWEEPTLLCRITTWKTDLSIFGYSTPKGVISGAPDSLMPAEWQRASCSLLSLKAFFLQESCLKWDIWVNDLITQLQPLHVHFIIWRVGKQPNDTFTAQCRWKDRKARCRNIVGEAASNSPHIVFLRRTAEYLSNLLLQLYNSAYQPPPHRS